jgi:hypothetical protein
MAGSEACGVISNSRVAFNFASCVFVGSPWHHVGLAGILGNWSTDVTDKRTEAQNGQLLQDQEWNKANFKFTSVVGRLLTWLPVTLTSWCVCPCVISFWVWAGPSVMFLVNRRQRMGGMMGCHFHIDYKRLGLPSLSLCVCIMVWIWNVPTGLCAEHLVPSLWH